MPPLKTPDGTLLHHHDWGSGRPVLLLGNAMQNSRMWERVARPLAEAGLRCVTVDRRGHGRSDWPWQGYDFDTLADDVATVVEGLDLRDAVLVGCAMGGGEAVRYVSRHGADRVGAVALVSSTTPFMMRAEDNPEGLDPAVFDAMAAELTADRAAWMAGATAAFFAGPEGDADDLPVSAAYARWICDMALDCSPRAALECYRTLFTEDLRGDLAGLAATGLPALVVHGDQDMGAPLELCGRRTAALLPKARFEVYEGAAHGLFATHADRLVEDLLTLAKA